VTPHGLRGTHATLATSAGASGELVAATLGHASSKVTEKHYIAPGTAEQAKQRRVLKVLQGGKG
jgi:integrase